MWHCQGFMRSAPDTTVRKAKVGSDKLRHGGDLWLI